MGDIKQLKTINEGASTSYWYTVEAKVGFMDPVNPIRLTDGILTTQWRELSFPCGVDGAGVPAYFPPTGLIRMQLPYASAVALAWTVLAQNRYGGISVRLRKLRQEVSYKTFDCGVVDGSEQHISYREPTSTIDGSEVPR